jgi:hypothetical protein
MPKDDPTAMLSYDVVCHSTRMPCCPEMRVPIYLGCQTWRTVVGFQLAWIHRSHLRRSSMPHVRLPHPKLKIAQAGFVQGRFAPICSSEQVGKQKIQYWILRWPWRDTDKNVMPHKSNSMCQRFFSSLRLVLSYPSTLLEQISCRWMCTCIYIYICIFIYIGYIHIYIYYTYTIIYIGI